MKAGNAVLPADFGRSRDRSFRKKWGNENFEVKAETQSEKGFL